jgi:hypothetical protein
MHTSFLLHRTVPYETKRQSLRAVARGHRDQRFREEIAATWLQCAPWRPRISNAFVIGINGFLTAGSRRAHG